MSKRNPFDYVKSINKKNYEYDLAGYNPFLTNRAFAGFIDTIMFAEAMNQAHLLSPALQYDFYYYAVRKGSRFDPVPKPEDPAHLDAVMDYYGYSRQKAMQAMNILTPTQVSDIVRKLDKGGKS